MKLGKLQVLFSAPRVDRYLMATGGDDKKTLKLLKTNLKIAKAFHPVLGVFEVILRNRLNESLGFYFADPDWIINKKSMLPGKLVIQIIAVEKRLRSSGGYVTSGKILADQNLGFWTDMFEKNNFKMLLGSPIHIFKYPPPVLGRKDVSMKLNQIRIFRNRINHNEPICFKANVIDFTYAESVHQAIYEVLDWIDPDARRFLKGVDSVVREIKRGKMV